MIARAFCLALLLMTHAAEAAGTKEPTVYVFWSAEGERSREAVAFIRTAAIADPKLSVRYFQLDKNPANNKILERAYRRIGVFDIYAIPTIFVGHNVFVGFDDPQNAGRKLLKDVEECRLQGCVDLVGDLIESDEIPEVMNDEALRAMVVWFPVDAGGRSPIRCAALPVDACSER